MKNCPNSIRSQLEITTSPLLCFVWMVTSSTIRSRSSCGGSHWYAVISCVTDRVEVGRCPSDMHVLVLAVLTATHLTILGSRFVKYSIVYKSKLLINPGIACVSVLRYYTSLCDRIVDVIGFRGRCHRASYLWRTDQTTNGSSSRHYKARALRNIPCGCDKALLRTHINRSMFWTRAARER